MHMRNPDPLSRYTAKRNFAVTPEPQGERAEPAPQLGYVIQKHWASRLHYDFRLELDGVLLSWAVPKGPSFDPSEKRMAVHVEDHPVSYGSFEGTIPPRQYGAGKVILWDRGTWEPVGDPREGMAKGKLLFRLHGQKLAGLWELVRIAKPGDKQDPWMLFKKRDAWARPLADYDVIAALPDSVAEKPLGLLEEREPRGGVVAGTPDEPAAASVAELPGAVKAPLPAALSPQLATVARTVPAGGGWIYELKLDGYRLLARLDRGRATLYTRNGHDWTDRMKPLAQSVQALGVRSGWLDGEIVVLDEHGMPSFNLLQNAFDAARTEAITYFLFDVPYADGHDLRQVPLAARRAWLRAQVEAHGSDNVRFSADFKADPASLLQSAARLGMEGIIAKRADAPYVSDRASTWLKLKATGRQELVVVGFIDREGSRREIGSLLLGHYDDGGVLHYAGNVGTGWDAATASRLHDRLVKLEVPDSPFAPGVVQPGRWSRRPGGNERWVKPEVVVEVRFADWTPDGSVRHAVYQGVREDVPPRTVRREAMVAAAPPAPGPRVGAVKVSNPERVIDPSTGLRKLDLVRYYESVADWMLPHLKGRPVSLVRGPEGITGELFFQKHDDKLSIRGLRELDAALWPGHPALLEVPTAEALVNAAQMNVIEFHTWNSMARSIDKPDRMVFDIDPGEGVTWARVQEAALLVRTLLDELKLKSWLKTSGGKGLHVVVPLAPKLDYDTVKAFSQAVVQHLARTVPSRFVAKSGAANRIGKVFVDYLRNGHGATTAAAFSARSRPGLGVSMPVAWEQLSSLKSGAQWSIATAREYLSFQKDDPWADYGKSRQTLATAMRLLGYTPAGTAGA
jgi:bifunctional non-homologous end joining protein LigD